MQQFDSVNYTIYNYRNFKNDLTHTLKAHTNVTSIALNLIF